MSRSTVRTVVGGVRQFVAGLVAGSLDGCGIPSIRRTAAPPPVAAPPREAPTAKRAPLKRPTEALAEASDRAAKQAALAAPVQKEARPKAAAAEEAGAMAGLECLGDLDELALSEEEGREGEGGGAEAERLQRLGSQPQVMPTEALQGQMGRREAGWAGRPGYVEPPQLQGSEYAPRPQLQPGSQRMVSPQMFHGQDMFQRQLSPGQHFQVGGLSQSPQSGMGLPPGMAAQMAAQQQQQQQGLQGLHGAGQQGDGMGWVMGHGGMSAPQQVRPEPTASSLQPSDSVFPCLAVQMLTPQLGPVLPVPSWGCMHRIGAHRNTRYRSAVVPSTTMPGLLADRPELSSPRPRPRPAMGEGRYVLAFHLLQGVLDMH